MEPSRGPTPAGDADAPAVPDQPASRLAIFLAWFPRRRALFTFIAGLVLLLGMRIPLIEQSLLGEPDRAMRETAFKLRANIFSGAADPVLLLDIDDASVRDPAYSNAPAGRLPSMATSRRLLADLLTYARRAPPGRRPKAVVLDVDIAAPTSEPLEVQRLRKALSEWAQDRAAPTLIIAREPVSPDLLELPGALPTLPQTDYDDIVAQAPNIYWAGTRMLGDQEGVVREILPYQCVMQPGGVQPLFSAAVLAYVLLSGRPRPGSPAALWLEEAPQACVHNSARQIEHGELINYHLSMHRGEDPAFPAVSGWNGARQCGETGSTPDLRRIPAAAVATAAAEASPDVLCSRLVIIGGTNSLANDFQDTPLEVMPGAIVLANAARGLQLTDGGLRQLGLPFQICLLAVFTLTITFSFAISRRARQHYEHSRRKRDRAPRKIVLVLLNPVMLNWVLGLAAHFVGVGLLIWALGLGYWGFLSGPVFGAALAETAQGFRDAGS